MFRGYQKMKIYNHNGATIGKIDDKDGDNHIRFFPRKDWNTIGYTEYQLEEILKKLRKLR